MVTDCLLTAITAFTPVCAVILVHMAIAGVFGVVTIDDDRWLDRFYITTGGPYTWNTIGSTGWVSTNSTTTATTTCDGNTNRTSWSGTCGQSGRMCSIDQGCVGGYHGTRVGTYCNLQDRVKVLTFNFCNLTGTLPDLSDADGDAMSQLEVFDFNLLFRPLGTFPPSYGQRMGSLKILSLQTTMLNGTIPSTLSGLSQLQTLRISGGAWRGTIPAALGLLSSLNYLAISGSPITGSIPDTFGSLRQLQRIDLSFNKLEGTLPDSFSSLTQLQSLDLQYNALVGSLTPSWSSMKNLASLRLSNNQLNGTIPAVIGSLSSLGTLDVSNNQLSGTLPEVSCASLYLNNNKFTGSLPAAYITNVTSLLDVSNNRLSGTLPEILINSTASPLITQVFVQNNQLTGCLPHSWALGLKLYTFKRLGFKGWGNCLNVSCSSPEDLAWWTPRTTSLTPQWDNCTSRSTFSETMSFSAHTSDASLQHSESPSMSRNMPTLTHRSARGSTSLSLTKATTTTESVVWSNEPQSSTSNTIASGFTVATMALTGPLSAMLSGFSGIPMLQQRLSSTLQEGAGSLYTAQGGFRVTDSPTQMVLGDPAAGGALRGAVVGNVVLVVGVLALQLAYGAVATVSKQPRCALLATTARNALRTAGLPGSWLAAAALPLLQPTAAFSVALLQGSSGLPTLAADVVLGVAGLLWTVGVLTLLIVKLDPRGASFGAVYRPPRRQVVALSWWVELLVGSDVSAWRSAEWSPQFVERYGALFVTTRVGRHWWAAAEAILSVLLAVVSVTSSGTDTEDVAAWAMAAVQVMWAIVHCVWTPYRALVDHVVAALLNVMCAAAAVCDAAGGVSASVALWLTAVTVCISVGGAVVPAVARVQLFMELWRVRALPEASSASSLPLMVSWCVSLRMRCCGGPSTGSWQTPLHRATAICNFPFVPASPSAQGRCAEAMCEFPHASPSGRPRRLPASVVARLSGLIRLACRCGLRRSMSHGKSTTTMMDFSRRPEAF